MLFSKVTQSKVWVYYFRVVFFSIFQNTKSISLAGSFFHLYPQFKFYI